SGLQIMRTHRLGAFTFYSRSHQGDECGSDGLPLTPNSVKIVGRFHAIKDGLQHPGLCRYLDIVRCKDEQLIVVSELTKRPLLDCLVELTLAQRVQILCEVADSVAYLHSRSIVCARLSASCIFLEMLTDSEEASDTISENAYRAKLFNYAMYYLTGCGEEVDFPVHRLDCAAPEVLLDSAVAFATFATADEAKSTQNSKSTRQKPNPECPRLDCSNVDSRMDSFGLGLLALHLLVGVPPLPAALPDSDEALATVAMLIRCGCTGDCLLDSLLAVDSDFTNAFKSFDWAAVDQELGIGLGGTLDMIRSCLSGWPSQRPFVSDLVSAKLEAPLAAKLEQLRSRSSSELGGFQPRFDIRCRRRFGQFRPEKSSVSNGDAAALGKQLDADDDVDVGPSEKRLITRGELASLRSVEEFYHWWTLAGGDPVQPIRQAGLVQRHRPITQLPCYLGGSAGLILYLEQPKPHLLHEFVVALNDRELRDRVRKLNPLVFFPVPRQPESVSATSAAATAATSSAPGRHGAYADTSSQPKAVKERDVAYQIERCVLFHQLLLCCPYARPLLLAESAKDIPPLYRALTWAHLLGVSGDVRSRYGALDTVTPRESRRISDKQLASDIPRCHQYNPLMASPHGHAKLRKLIKAWVLRRPSCAYYQGVDSVAAVFLHLNFSDEPLALACLERFIDKYQANFFANDNNKEVTQEYFAVFQQLLAFHCPTLAVYLEQIGLFPDHYAFPWFLTMFAHHFSLPSVVHIWDALLLGNSSFPLFVGLAILLQLKRRLGLMEHDFNEAVHDILPQVANVNLELCLSDATRMYRDTPHSCSYRKFDGSDLELCGQQFPIDTLGIEALQRCRAPRISQEEFLTIAGHLDAKVSCIARSRLSIIDIRPAGEYGRGCLPNSIHLPAETVLSNQCDLARLSDPVVQANVKVLIYRLEEEAVSVANHLVMRGVTRVCLLQGGVEGLRSTGLLALPSN
ncbi:hypothetical protein BOX15_Mlig003833g1, partial [Macrostomum lignano]